MSETEQQQKPKSVHVPPTSKGKRKKGTRRRANTEAIRQSKLDRILELDLAGATVRQMTEDPVIALTYNTVCLYRKTPEYQAMLKEKSAERFERRLVRMDAMTDVFLNELHSLATGAHTPPAVKADIIHRHLARQGHREVTRIETHTSTPEQPLPKLPTLGDEFTGRSIEDLRTYGATGRWPEERDAEERGRKTG